jgi:hypothetical protein
MDTRTDWRTCKRAESYQIIRRQKWHTFLTRTRERDEDEDEQDGDEREARHLYACDAECRRLITNWLQKIKV